MELAQGACIGVLARIEPALQHLPIMRHVDMLRPVDPPTEEIQAPGG